MKKLRATLLVLAMVLLTTYTVDAGPRVLETHYGTAYEVRLTYYTGAEENEWIGSTGNELHFGICAAAKEYAGKDVRLYAVENGAEHFVGFFTVADTGASWWAKPITETGARIDLWFEDNAAAEEWFGQWGDDVTFYAIIEKGIG